VADARAKIEKDYERKQASLSSKNKITAAKENNKRRLELLKEQESIVSSAIASAGQQLQSFSQNDKARYAQLLENLILQGLNKMQDEDTVRVHCLASEVAMAEAATAKAKSRFEAKHHKVMNVQVDTQHALPDTDPATGEPSYGGVAISNMDHTIICQNTLNARLHIAAEACLPKMKNQLFPTMQQLMSELK
jgi:vacuolar-type H+-ATPase subunit E/Vma4